METDMMESILSPKTEYCSSCEDEQDAERMEYMFLTEDESLGGWYCRICINNGLVEVQGY